MLTEAMPARPPAGRMFEAALLAAILLLGGWYFFLSGSRFDRATWLAAEAGSRTRADMAADLVARYRLERRTDRQIVALLGPPTRTERWPDRELAYALGPRRAWQSGRREWLLLDVDPGGRILSYELTHD
jgi:hypothetical protein